MKTPGQGPDRLTMAAFSMLVLLTGANYVAVRLSNQGLRPFLGAGLRFGAASLFFLVNILIQKYPLPRGRALAGTLLYGILQFGVSYALTYHALVAVPAGLMSVIIATSPIITMLMARAAGIEQLTLRGTLGAAVAFAGIACIFRDRIVMDIPLIHLLSAFGTVVVISFSAVLFKLIPVVHLQSMNGLGMLTGALFLLGLSFASGEKVTLPVAPATLAVLFYLVLFGSVFMYILMLFVLRRWTASGVSYQTVLSPVFAILLSAWLLHEPVSSGLLLGAALVLIGVYLGILAPSTQSGKLKTSDR